MKRDYWFGLGFIVLLLFVLVNWLCGCVIVYVDKVSVPENVKVGVDTINVRPIWKVDTASWYKSEVR